MPFSGALTALVTPFKNGRVDEATFRAFIEWQIQEGIDGLVPCGTTGESATLSHQEHEEVIRICIDQAKGRVPVIAGSGSNNTTEAIALTRFAEEAGADAALLISPYYNKPSQEGLIAHFKAVAAEVSIPIIVYNVPGRTGGDIKPETVRRLFQEVPGIIGIKEATGDVVRISDLVELCGGELCVLSGDDFTILPTVALGGRGVISVISNLAPRKTAELCAAANAGDMSRARKLHYELAPICRACFVETSPGPVKAALGLMGKMSPELRLPLVQPEPASLERIATLLKGAGLV